MLWYDLCARLDCTWHGLGSAPVVLGSCLKELRLVEVAVHADDIEGPASVTLQAKDVACSKALFSSQYGS